MFERIGKLNERWWHGILAAWVLAAVFSSGLLGGWINRLNILPFNLPAWRDLVDDGEFAYLPGEMQSLKGEELLSEAFPKDLLKSSVVVVVRRESQSSDLTTEDYQYIENVLKPGLEQIMQKEGSIISSVKTASDPLIGQMLDSVKDKKASLIIVALTKEFLFEANGKTIKEIEKLIDEAPRPVGLDVALSGSATVGRDMIKAAGDSAKATENWTTILVIALLLIIYRAPLLAIIPLVTVAVSVTVAKAAVALYTSSPLNFANFRVFNGLEVYIVVVVYGTGVDYCLFLIARYKEEIDNGAKWRQAITLSISKVGAALTASALTVICGIGMMFFAQFGKFREAGVFISLSLCVGLLASLTLTPALLRAAGHLAFWPYGRSRKLPEVGGWISGTTLFSRIFDGNRVHQLWERTGQALLQIPGKAWLTCVVLMLPFAAIGFWFHDYLSYGLLSELQPTTKSVIGAKAVQAHFPAGYAGPLTIILKNDTLNFAEEEGEEVLTQVLNKLVEQKKELRIHDIRSLENPLGLSPPVSTEEKVSTFEENTRKLVQHKKALEYYVSEVPNLEGKVTRFDIIFEDDPFSRESIQQLTAVEKVVRDSLPAKFFEAGTINLIGPTASIRDLKTVTDQDQVRIDALVLIAVFTILVILLRKPAISLYLILTVFFSYFVTLGVTVAVFWWLDPKAFAGLDWKVPIYLFTILIAIGEDYNIFLMTRIDEEQVVHGPVQGIRVAVQRTGSIISSCGIIMAGTFCSLMAGTLVGMQQLGFALAFGVLLDTFVVRPVLVPAYLVMLFNGQFGRFGRLLGNRFAVEDLHTKPESAAPPASPPPPTSKPDEPPEPDNRTPPSLSQSREMSVKS